jgi:hypothetical protein
MKSNIRGSRTGRYSKLGAQQPSLINVDTHEIFLSAFNENTTTSLHLHRLITVCCGYSELSIDTIVALNLNNISIICYFETLTIDFSPYTEFER